jgi:Flp pilus assembly pilin Flp
MNEIIKAIISVVRDDRGQGLVEYALIIALVSLAAISALAFFGQRDKNSLSNSGNVIPG